MAKPANDSKNDTLQQTLLEYQAILENASVGVLFTRDRKVVHCNPRFTEIYGWTGSELVGQPGSLFYLSTEDYEAVGRRAGPILAAGQPLDIELPMRRKDGSAVLCRLRAKAIDSVDNRAGTIWIIEDVSAQREEQARLAELLQRQQAILENASVGILFTRDGQVVHCNPRVEAIHGWAPGTLVGQSSRVFFDSDEDARRFAAAVGPILGRGELVDIEWRHTRRLDGVRIWTRHLAKALPSSDGSQGAIWISEDISAQKDAQEALALAHHELERRVEERTEELARINQQLRVEEARFRDLTEMASDWFWEMDAELRFVDISGGHLSPTHSTDGAIGLQRWDLPIEGLTPADWTAHRRVLEARLPFKDFTYQLRTHRGDLRWCAINGKPFFENGVFKGYRGTGTDITERKQAEQRIEFLAYNDPLTGLPNRVLLEDRLAQAIAQAERKRNGLALVFMDLDNFKKINDSLGHAAGDALLKEVAARLKSCVRDTDTLSRQGGDEFVLILRDLHGAESSLPVLTKVMEKLQEPYVCEGNEISTSASLGVAVYPQDGSDFDILRKKADMAMYRAKEAGRNTYRFFDEAMDEEAVEHLLMRSGLRRAIERGEFVLHYQPQVDIASGRVIGAEALLRWEHPEFGLVYPDRFIPVAEDSGLIVPIGAWVIQEACRQTRRWQEAGLPELVMAVNLSAMQFRRGAIEDTVAQALADSGLMPALLELELTESILLQDVEQVMTSLQRLKQLGVQLAIDDFGTGYSSLSYLKRFDIDKLKIDRSFVRDLVSDPDDAAIVRAIIQMAHSLGLKVIAEGVETAELLLQLRSFGCDEAQGYHYARPMPAADFERFLASRA